MKITTIKNKNGMKCIVKNCSIELRAILKAFMASGEILNINDERLFISSLIDGDNVNSIELTLSNVIKQK